MADLKDAATSPIPAVRSLPSIREEKSVESNENSGERGSSKEKIGKSSRTLMEAPTDELRSTTANEEVPSHEHEIQQTLSRIAARIRTSLHSKSSMGDDNHSSQQKGITNAKGGNVDPLYDCVDCICGDEDGKIPRRFKNDCAYGELENVLTIGSTGRILTGNNSCVTSSGDDLLIGSSKSADDKIRGVGIHVTCINHKQPMMPMSEEVPSLGIELVYYDEDSITLASPTSVPPSQDEQVIEDDQHLGKAAASDLFFRDEEQPMPVTEDDSYGFPMDSLVIPKSISFVDRRCVPPRGQVDDGKDSNNHLDTDILKAVSYHDGYDTDRLLEEHPIQASLWTKVQGSRATHLRADVASTTSNCSSMIVNTGTERDSEQYCESIPTTTFDDSASSTTASPSVHDINSRNTLRYDDIVQTLLCKTQRLLDAILKFDYLEYASLTTSDITGIQINGQFQQGRSFHSYYGTKTRIELTTFGKTRNTTMSSYSSFLDLVPVHQSVSSPTVRLVSPQVAIVSYKVVRKILERGRIVESEIFETRVWENRLSCHDGMNVRGTDDGWLNCHYHVSIVAPVANVQSSVTSSTEGADKQSKTTTSSSSVPYYDI
jgi:hypothetical protein